MNEKLEEWSLVIWNPTGIQLIILFKGQNWLIFLLATLMMQSALSARL